MDSTRHFLLPQPRLRKVDSPPLPAPGPNLPEGIPNPLITVTVPIATMDTSVPIATNIILPVNVSLMNPTTTGGQ